MKQIKEFPREVVEYPDMGIIMSDGTRLSARVWMPKDADRHPVPAILEHIPYRKRDGTMQRDQFSHPWMAGHGYCCIRTDIRGNGESEGLMLDEYTQQELDDACEVIAWAANQSWCNGNVGMQGISWGGFNSLQVAAMRPPALKAVISLCSTVDRYADDIHYKGGCILVENFGWASTMLSYSSRPPDPELVGEKWQDIWRERLDAQPWLWKVWHEHQHRDDYWKHGSVCEDYTAIEAAVLSVGGWHDGYRNTISHLVENLAAPAKGIVGPWNHKYPHYAGPKPAIGFLQESKRWWDKWLKGIETGVDQDPAYRAYLIDALEPKRWYETRPGRWIASETWPSAEIETLRLHFGEHTLGSADTKIELSIKSPQHCGLASGEYFPFAFADELPDEQAHDDALSLCFDGLVLEEDLDLVGAPELRLTLCSDKPHAQIAVRLCDIGPEGTSALISHGFLNLAHRISHEHPTDLCPGQEFDVTVTLDQIAYHLPQGHRLRVAVSTCYWPFIWPSPESAEITVYSGDISIPVRRSSYHGDEWLFEEPVGAPHWEVDELRPASYKRDISRDETSGVVTVKVDSDSGENRDVEHGLISGSRISERFSIHPDDPSSAKATAEWQQTGGRPGALWETQVKTEMTSDAANFYSVATIRAFLNGEAIFEKEFKDTVPRK